MESSEDEEGLAGLVPVERMIAILGDVTMAGLAVAAYVYFKLTERRRLVRAQRAGYGSTMHGGQR